MKHEGGGDTNCNSWPRNDPKGSVRELKEMEIGEHAENIQTTALLRSV